MRNMIFPNIEYSVYMKITQPAVPQNRLPGKAKVASEAAPPTLKLVSIGDSLTAGMQACNLSEARQQSSYPNFIARQAGLEFTQPLLDNQGVPPKLFLSPGTSLNQTLWRYAQVSLAMAPALGALALGLTPPEWSLWPMYHVGGMGKPVPQEGQPGQKVPYQNLAIPGFELRHLNDVRRVHDILGEMADGVHQSPQIAALAPYTKYILQNPSAGPSGQSEIEQGIAQKPDVVLFWAGNNDILAAALDGKNDDTTLTPMADRKWTWTTHGLLGDKKHVSEKVMPGLRNSLTGPEGALTRLLQETDAEIMVMNVPDVTVIPNMRKLGEPVGKLPFKIALPDGTDITKRIEGWRLPTAVNGDGVGGRSHFPEGSTVSLINVMKKFTHYFNVQNVQDLDVALAAMGEGKAAFTEDDVIDPGETKAIQKRTQEYNGLIEKFAAKNPRLHLVDVNGLLSGAQADGLALQGEGPEVKVTNTFTGLTDDRGFRGIFSGDGVHPSDLGYALVANRILDKARHDLGADPRFQALTQAQRIDEKAVLAVDPEAGDRPTLVLHSMVVDRLLASIC